MLGRERGRESFVEDVTYELGLEECLRVHQAENNRKHLGRVKKQMTRPEIAKKPCMLSVAGARRCRG